MVVTDKPRVNDKMKIKRTHFFLGTTTYIEQKNTGTSVLIHPQNASFGLSIEIRSRFSRLVCFN